MKFYHCDKCGNDYITHNSYGMALYCHICDTEVRCTGQDDVE